MTLSKSHLLATCLVPCFIVGSSLGQTPDAMILRGVKAIRQELSNQNEIGKVAIGLLALVKTHEESDTTFFDDPFIKKLIARLLANCENGVYRAEAGAGPDNYESACVLMALAAIDQKKYLPQITIIADFIMKKQTDVGSWHYGGSQDGDGDTSMTQFALLGLWEAANAGVDIPIPVWDKALYWWCTRQDIGGGFCYHPVDPKGESRVAQKESRHTLTMAGAACMYICQIKLPIPKRRHGKAEQAELLIPVEPEVGPGQYKLKCTSDLLDRSLSDANRWVNSHFTVDAAKGNEALHARLYFVYALERYGVLARTERIGGQNWRNAGTEFLRKVQKPSGTWDDGDFGPIADTSFGLLFLGRSTEIILKKVITTYGRGTMLGGRGLPSAGSMPDGIPTRKKLKYAMALESNVDDVLKAFDDPNFTEIDDAKADQAAIAMESLTGEEILQKTGGDARKLRMLALDKRVEVRRVGLQALVRTKDYRIAPILIKALGDPDPDCYRIARDGLRFLSRKTDDMGLPEKMPTPEQRLAGITKWNKWFDGLKLKVDADQEFDDPAYPVSGPVAQVAPAGKTT